VALSLPDILISRQDVVQAHRELGGFIDSTMQSVMRHDNPIKYPAISAELQAVASVNQIDLRHEAECRKLLADLEQLSSQAPIIQFSFADEPPLEVLQKIVARLRKEINPQIVVKIGLNPTIAGGMIMQTPAHRYDFSLRRQLNNHRKDLIKAFKVATTG
jgi:F0F1-type ATP synthase delta subunit